MTYTAPIAEQRFVLDTIADLPGLARLNGFEAATPDMAPGTPPSARWAHLLGRPGLSRAVDQLQGATLAASARTGDPTPSEEDRRAFVSAVRSAEPTIEVTGHKESA